MESRVLRCNGCGVYRRMCGTVWNAEALAVYDAGRFVESVAGIGSITIQANDCTGYAYWPSTAGRTHGRLGSRDLVRDLVAEARRRDLRVCVEYNALHAAWFWDDHPDARIVDPRGVSRRLDASAVGIGRPVSPCCPNSSGYRRFAAEELRELCDRYDPDEFSLALVYWPEICYCDSCRTRFREETGRAEPPTVVDWGSAEWTLFQRRREEWLADYARMLAAVVRSCSARATVTLRADVLASGWQSAPSLALFDAVDRASAYSIGGRAALGFAGKLLSALSLRAPFELLADPPCPVTAQSNDAAGEESLRCAFAMATLTGGTLSSSPPLDAGGEIAPSHAATLRRLTRAHEPSAPLRGGAPREDVGIFVDLRALFDLDEWERVRTADGGAKQPGVRGEAGHLRAARSLARALAEAHVPYGIATSRQLDDLSRFHVIALPNLPLLGAREIETLRSFVREGGCLYASGPCGVLDETGRLRSDFPLAELFGVSLERVPGKWSAMGEPEARSVRCPAAEVGAPPAGMDAGGVAEAISIAPTRRALDFFEPFDTGHPARGVPGAALLRVHLTAEAELLATAGSRPVVTMNRFGKGRAMYAAMPLEEWDRDDERRIVARLFRHLIDRPFTIESDAPRCVEIALWRDLERGRYLLHLLNFQSELPNVPVRDVTVRANLGEGLAHAARIVPSGRPLDVEPTEEGIELTIPRLDTYLLVEIT